MTTFEKELINALSTQLKVNDFYIKENDRYEKQLDNADKEIRVLRSALDAKNNLNERLTEKIGELEAKLMGDYIVEEDNEEKRTEC